MNLEIIIIISSILFSAFFSGMEIAFVSANKLHMELEKKREGFLPKILRRLTQKSSKFIIYQITCINSLWTKRNASEIIWISNY